MFAAALPFLLLPLLAPPAYAQEAGADSDRAVVIEDIRAVESNGRIYLDAQARFALSPPVATALNQEEELVFVTEIQVVRDRDYLPPDALVDVQINRRLTFHALTRKYIVEDLTFSRRTVSESLAEALEDLGRYRNVAVVEKLLAVGSGATHVRMRVGLARRHLSPLLRARSMVSPDWWRMSSDWYRWRL